MIRIAIDMMGGDNSYQTTIPAVKQILEKHCDLCILALGDKAMLSDLETSYPERVIVIHAPEVVPMEAGVLDVLRLKESPIIKGIELVKDKEADAMVSAGSTGGFLSAATLKLKTLEGIERAALVSPFPTQIKGKQAVVLDIGANNENSAKELTQFALMGRLYAQAVVGTPEPKTYLLSNGSEDQKGSPVSKEAFKMLQESQFPGFMGNVEASLALDGRADVIVADGFNGNIFLKAGEGMAKWMARMVKAAFKRNVFSKIGYLMTRRGIKEMNATLNYKELGGALLLGINGICVKAHGNSKPMEFYYAIEIAYKLAHADVNKLISEGLRREK